MKNVNGYTLVIIQTMHNRIVLINELGILQFLDPHYRPSKDQTIPPYFSQILKDSSRYAK